MTRDEYTTLHMRRALRADDRPAYVAMVVDEERDKAQTALDTAASLTTIPEPICTGFAAWWNQNEAPKHAAKAGEAFDAIFGAQEIELRYGYQARNFGRDGRDRYTTVYPKRGRRD